MSLLRKIQYRHLQKGNFYDKKNKSIRIKLEIIGCKHRMHRMYRL